MRLNKMILIIAPLMVAICVFILYAIERRSKSEPISWEAAGKLVVFGGLITAGIVFSITTNLEVPLPIAEIVETTQDMFVGTPTF